MPGSLIAQWHTPVPPSKPPLRADDSDNPELPRFLAGAFPLHPVGEVGRLNDSAPGIVLRLVPQQLAPRASSLTVVISNTLGFPGRGACSWT